MDIYERDQFPSEKIQQKLINHIFCGFKNFQYNILCPKCSDIFAITILSDKITCPSCNNVIKNNNLIIKVNSFDLEFFCIKCGFLNEPTINNHIEVKPAKSNNNEHLEEIIDDLDKLSKFKDILNYDLSVLVLFGPSNKLSETVLFIEGNDTNNESLNNYRKNVVRSITEKDLKLFLIVLDVAILRKK